MSDEQPLTQREFDLFQQLAKERQETNIREQARLGAEIDLVAGKALADVQAVRQEHATDMAKLATQREQDLKDAREQRDEDLGEAKRVAEHRKEWSWSTKLAAAGLALALAGLYVQYIVAHK